MSFGLPTIAGIAFVASIMLGGAIGIVASLSADPPEQEDPSLEMPGEGPRPAPVLPQWEEAPSTGAKG